MKIVQIPIKVCDVQEILMSGGEILELVPSSIKSGGPLRSGSGQTKLFLRVLERHPEILVKRTFRMIKVGVDFDDPGEMQYIGTVHTMAGVTVALFEIMALPPVKALSIVPNPPALASSDQ